MLQGIYHETFCMIAEFLEGSGCLVKKSAILIRTYGCRRATLYLRVGFRACKIFIFVCSLGFGLQIVPKINKELKSGVRADCKPMQDFDAHQTVAPILKSIYYELRTSVYLTKAFQCPGALQFRLLLLCDAMQSTSDC